MRSLAAAHRASLDVNRDSSDPDIKLAVRKIAVNIHPDKGGSKEDTQRLLQARDDWMHAGASKRAPGRPGKDAGRQVVLPTVQKKPGKGYRMNGEAVLLTYQGIPPAAFGQRGRLQGFVRLNFQKWKLRHWCATMEANESGGSNFHVMLQFHQAVDWTTSRFVFEAARPNAATTDYLGQGFCKRRMQELIDRGMVYVFAGKIGAQRAPRGQRVRVRELCPSLGAR